VRAHCAPRAQRWREKRSLSELLADADARLRHARSDETLQEIYDRLHREIFGTISRRSSSEANEDLFARLFAFLRREEIDLATYVAGNMWAMKPWVESNPRIGFQPNHLSGERALRRYYAYLGRQRRRFRQQRHTGETGGTLTANIRQQIFLGEYAVGLEYVRTYVAEGDASWAAAIEEAQPSADWRAVECGPSGGKRYHELCTIFGTHRLSAEKQRATLKAACVVAESYEHDLSHRVGVRGAFTWADFAVLIARLYPLDTPSDTLSLAEVQGVAWHGC
jgi:hypothetical protein